MARRQDTRKIRSPLIQRLVKAAEHDEKGGSPDLDLPPGDREVVEAFQDFLLQRRELRRQKEAPPPGGDRSTPDRPPPVERPWSRIEDRLERELARQKEYEIREIWLIEAFRNFLEVKRSNPASDFVLRPRPPVRFDLTARSFRLIDATNSVFEIDCELSVGVSLDDAVTYLVQAGLSTDRQKLLAQVKLDSILIFEQERVRELLTALLKVRLRTGSLEEKYGYFRYGTRSDRIWYIQNVKATLFHAGGFASTPFDRFLFSIDFHVGLGPDITHVDLNVDEIELPARLLAQGFGSGEFLIDAERSRLLVLGILEDETHYFENVARLEIAVRRSPLRILTRIGVPLLFMVLILLAGSWTLYDMPRDLTVTMIPTLFVAMVALQLTAVQGMPRDSPLSILDYLFLASYTLVIWLFLGLLDLPWINRGLELLGHLTGQGCCTAGHKNLRCAVSAGAAAYAVAVLVILALGLYRFREDPKGRP
jgi:hypothetical protein